MKLASTAMPTGELVWCVPCSIALATIFYAVLTGAFRTAWRLLSRHMVLRAIGDVGGAISFQSALARMSLAMWSPSFRSTRCL